MALNKLLETKGKVITENSNIFIIGNPSKESSLPKSAESATNPDITIYFPVNNNHYTYATELPTGKSYYFNVDDLHYNGKVWFYSDNIQVGYFHNTYPTYVSYDFSGSVTLTSWGSHKFKVKSTNYIFGIPFTSTKEVTYYLDAPTPPSAPTNLNITGYTGDHPQLSWTGSSGATGYKIYKQYNQTGTFSLKAIIGTTTNWEDTSETLDPSRYGKYRAYYVKAYNNAGTSGASNTDICWVYDSLQQ